MRVVLGSTWFRSIAARATCPAFAASGFWGKLSAMSVVKEKIFPGNIAAWLAVLFILLATMAIGTPTASAIPTHRDYTSQNRVGENSVAAVQLRLAQSPQTPELQRESSIGRYDLALDDTLAAEDGPLKNPKTGEPGSQSTVRNPDGAPKQVRRYGPDGNPQTDVDYGHGHELGPNGQPVGSPHAHDWTPNPNGGFPIRGPARPVRPDDPQ